MQVIQSRSLREQDFGFYEGKPFYARPRGSNKTGKESHRDRHVDDPEFRDVESKESMNLRMNDFVKDQISPLIKGETSEREEVVSVVSHGIILSHLWRSILKLFGKASVILAPGLSVGGSGMTPLEYLGGWSNTGYLELDIQCNRPTDTTSHGQCSTTTKPEAQSMGPEESCPPSLRMIIKTVNGKEHLKGLKRTRGVGSSQYDEGQKKIESFFKKVKVS